MKRFLIHKMFVATLAHVRTGLNIPIDHDTQEISLNITVKIRPSPSLNNLPILVAFDPFTVNKEVVKFPAFLSIGLLTTIVLASGLAQGEPTAPQQKGSAGTPAAQTKSADAVKSKPVPASKPPRVVKVKPAPAVKPAPVAKVKPVPAVKPLYPVKTNLPQVAKEKPAPTVKPDVVAKIKPVPAVKSLYPVKTNLPEVAKVKPAPAVKPDVVAKIKPVPAVKSLYPVKTNLPEVAKEKPAPAAKPAPVAKVKGVEPVAAVVVFREPTKTQKLAALLESYKANEITPTQYHDGRAALIARQ
ncbi:MAG: hypothetical protein DVB32_05030 [Verrucomicrobia bacterium]|nr:MAG: hypothetical protein DVB32_05030 [Verrucomicrobiota bacterium]